jgi:hypothetical protein
MIFHTFCSIDLNSDHEQRPNILDLWVSSIIELISSDVPHPCVITQKSMNSKEFSSFFQQIVIIEFWVLLTCWNIFNSCGVASGSHWNDKNTNLDWKSDVLVFSYQNLSFSVSIVRRQLRPIVYVKQICHLQLSNCTTSTTRTSN